LKYVQFRMPALVSACEAEAEGRSRAPALLSRLVPLGFLLALTLLVGPGSEQADAARKARLIKGQAIAPKGAPHRVERAITAANRIAKGKGYCYGGGHADWKSRCYDCSGAVSYALGDRGARVVRRPRPSGDFMRWRTPGKGKWITVYANSGHAYAVIAGLRFDTSMTAGAGPGWSKERRSSRGYRERHPRHL
jgi:hypothetical protein